VTTQAPPGAPRGRASTGERSWVTVAGALAGGSRSTARDFRVRLVRGAELPSGLGPAVAVRGRP
jgi:hypothetical protein